MTHLLTIGIPTFNRKQCVSRFVEELIDREVSDFARVLVIDDGGSDGSFDALREIRGVDSDSIRVARNDKNEGYAFTFNRLFTECQTDYLMLMADDDSIIYPNLVGLIDYIEDNRPDFVSPQFLIGDKTYRGSDSTAPISAYEFFGASAHAPGLVYRVAACKHHLGAISKRSAIQKYDALLYPQVCLLIALLAEGADCRWLALPTACAKESAPSGLRDASGKAYWSVESRWCQLKDFDEYTSGILETHPNETTNVILKTSRDRVLGHILTGMEMENPELRKAFDKSARRFYLKQWIKLLFGVQS